MYARLKVIKSFLAGGHRQEKRTPVLICSVGGLLLDMECFQSKSGAYLS